MLTNRFSMLFYLKKRSNYVSGPLPIYIRVSIGSERFELATKRECEPEKWNAAAGRKNGTREDTRLLNAYLDTFQAKVYEAHRQLMSTGNEITIEALKASVTGVAEKKIMFLEQFAKHNARLVELKGTDYAHGTILRYNTSYQHTKEYIKWKFKLGDIEIEKLSYEFITDFEFWLKTQKKCGHNTTMRYLGYCKKIVLGLIKTGLLPRDPFFGYKVHKKETNRAALTEKELKVIANKKFPSSRLSQVRDIFLFSCYTGLSYVDVQKPTRSEITIGQDGEQWLIINRQKTDSQSRVLLLPVPLQIIAKYEHEPQCEISGKLLPVSSNQKMNAYLKEIAAVCGIDRNISFHIARHTFATTVTLSNGVPMESVSKMLGHSNIRTTQIYAKIVDRKISEDMRSLREKLSK
ncbi:site-specific integrase [Dyadobacter sp. CY261]|uniref:site-specific integrase n=1 Tax=Dyadobacter sp. CY261 TaxID=2907203 RepID=UPI001F3ED845|nr:site-specific integrase [Dyadobacter sp. CY261]MCF0072204.1 site-specific integrase [Dyadobacter sp. CY261]